MYSLSKLHETHGKVEIETFTPISKDDYDFFLKDEAQILQFLTIKNHFDITELNINEFMKHIQDIYESLHQEKVLILKEPDFIKLNINRLFLNFIFSFKTYLEYLETFLKREFGNASSEVNEFKQLTAKLYDNHFEYRFFYKLRNYAQHCGIPIEHFTISPRIKNDLYSVKMTVEFDTKSLLEKFNSWGEVLKEELQKMAQNIDVVTTTKQYAQIIKEIQQWLHTLITPIIDPLKTKIQKLTGDKIKDTNGICITYEKQGNPYPLIINSVFRYISQLEKLPLKKAK